MVQGVWASFLCFGVCLFVFNCKTVSIIYWFFVIFFYFCPFVTEFWVFFASGGLKRGFFLNCEKKNFIFFVLVTSVFNWKKKFFEKNILVEWKKVVLLQPFSARGDDDREQRNLKWWEDRDSVCRPPCKDKVVDTKTSQKVKWTILTMKSLILAQDER